MMVRYACVRVCVCEDFLCKISLVKDDDVKCVVCCFWGVCFGCVFFN